MPRAMVLPRLGADVPFAAQSLDLRPLAAGEVRVAVRAASVNPVDTKIRSGAAASIAPESPIVLGCDMAGVVTEIGEGVEGFDIGDAVFGCTGGVKQRDGSYQAVVRCDARLLAPKPEALTFRKAAALPLVGITAWEALIDRVLIEPGMRVLVIGGAGGVGHIGVQLAAAQGAIVHSTAGTDAKADIAHTLGAREVIDYKKESLEEASDRLTDGQGYDVVFDTVGGSHIETSLKLLTAYGQCVTTVSGGATPDLSPLHQKSASLHVVFMLLPMLMGKGLDHHGRILNRLGAMVGAGTLKPILDESRFDLEEVSAAHERLLSGDATGKIVLGVEDPDQA